MNGPARAWQVRKSALGTIYAVATTNGERVKIGFTTELARRLADLSKKGCPYGPIGEVIHTALGTFSDEQRLHSTLREWSAYVTEDRAGPRELYPVSVLNHPACLSIFGQPAATKKRARAA